MRDVLDLGDPFVRGLTCAALHPGLRSILVFDAARDQLDWAADLLAQMLWVVDGASVVERLRLGTTDTDDVLWGMPFPALRSGGLGFIWRGLLTGGRTGSAQQVIIIPDLTRLGLAAQRAIVTTMGAEVVHLERHGQHASWQPRICWLAGCTTETIGQVSPHLLDRFALRLRMPTAVAHDSVVAAEELLRALGDEKSRTGPVRVQLPAGVAEELQRAAQQSPPVTEEAARRVVAYQPSTEAYSPRRDVALGRMALAIAMLEDAEAVLPGHVDGAAEIIGLRPPVDRPPILEDSKQEDAGKQPMPPAEPEPVPPTVPPPGQPSQADGQLRTTAPVYEPDAEEVLPRTSLPPNPGDPYPEDGAPIEREADSLRLPTTRRGGTSRARGPAVGARPATGLDDLALASTIFEAAKYQVLRRQHEPTGDRAIIIRPGDLRSYRRIPVPEKMLVLVLDYTALRDCKWDEALIPHLEWAYTERASIALIRVGAADTVHELRADRLVARSLLVPQVDKALAAGPGRASPLAHGLDLALQTLRHALQHGRAALTQARLVVFTDGRGNVPLEASHAGQITRLVTREGIYDAINVATQIRALERVEKVFLNPQPPQHKELPLELASALNAASTEVPLIDDLPAIIVRQPEEVAV